MRIAYVLLSSTFGMHQYTADLADRIVQLGHEAHLITTTHLPRDRYAAGVNLHTPIDTAGTGFSREGLKLAGLRSSLAAICSTAPDIVHFTGPHLWNVALVRSLARRGIPVIHTLHDLNPHRGVRYKMLIRLWNHMVVRSAQHILVHGHTYRERLLAGGLDAERVTCTPLLHLFLADTRLDSLPSVASSVEYEPWALFFGRLEQYKGIDDLIAACAMLDGADPGPRVVLAGMGNLKTMWADILPPRLELRNRLILDVEAIDLFRRCGLVVLPYADATQSAMIAAAYYFRKPVVVTRSGALPEYVISGQTGRVVEPGHPAALARCLEEMLKDRVGLARMGETGRRWYDLHRADEEQTLLEMYERLALKS